MRMKRIAFIPFIAALASAQTSPHAAWQNVQSVTVSSSGLHRLDLPPATLSAAQAGLEDLRLSDAQGVDQPFVIKWPLPASTRQPQVENFRVTLQPQRTILDMDTGTTKPIRALVLECAARDFIKAASIEASNDRSQWQSLITDGMIFRQSDGAGNTAFTFAKSQSWAHLRVTIRDDSSPAIAFTGARIEWQEPRAAPVPLDVNVSGREEAKGETRLRLELRHSNQFLAELNLRVSDALFSRRVSVQTGTRTIASAQLHRLTVNGRQTQELTMPVFAQVPSNEITLVIVNNDSPPLKIEGIDATRDPVSLAFHASAPSTWSLFTGNPAAKAPTYDVAALANDLRSASSMSATITLLEPNPAFNKAATQPETGLSGASLDLAGWSYRKAVTLPGNGVSQIELDLDVLAHARDDLGDLRLVQGGRQVPFLLQQTSRTTTLPVTITAEPDAKRPSVSRWRLSVSQRHLPLRRLTLQSPTPVFERSMRIIESRRDHYGNESPVTTTSASWSHIPAHQPELTLTCYQRWQGNSVILETDNGDNSPIELSTAKADLDVVAIVFKTTEPEPVHLYYGHPRTTMPRYDLRLVEKDLTTVPPVIGKLSDEEVLTNNPAYSDTPKEAASPWLWVALGVVVIGLIAVMAKLLPKTETPA